MIKVSSAQAQKIPISAGHGRPISVIQQGQHYPTYTGDTTVTPSQHTQTLSTSGSVLKADIVINPIPNNYGRIEWNGVTLSVI